MQCLQAKPSKLEDGVAAGSKTLFDDFVYVHMMATTFIHFTVSIRLLSNSLSQENIS